MLPLLAAAGFGSSSAVAATPALPRLPEREGELVACPTQEVLATRFSTQSNGNGGGFGYYSAAYDDNRVPSIVRPRAEAVDAYVHDQAPGRIPTADEKLTFLWGLRCAYPEVDYVKDAFDAVRADWLATTGVSKETEAAWHTLQADAGRSGRLRAGSCPDGDAWHPEDPAHLARQYVLCGGMAPRPAEGNLLDALDVAADPVVAAGVVTQCAENLPREGDGRDPNGAYWDWKVCTDVAATYDREALDAALVAGKVDDWSRLAFEVEAEKARAQLDRLAPGFAKFEKGWPAAPRLYAAAVAQVNEKYVPMLEKWRPTLDEIDVWTDELRGGPGFAEGCADRWGGLMQKYLAESGVKPTGSALWEVLREPVGVGLLEAYALCRSQTGAPAYAQMVTDNALAGVHRVSRWHRGLVDALHAGVRADGTWQGQPLPPAVVQVPFSAEFSADPARAWLRVSDRAPDQPYSYEETLAGVSVKGEIATLTFPKRSGTASVPTNCAPDYSHVARIDEFGKFWYDNLCTGSKTVSVNETFRPVEVPAWEAAKLASGMKVAVQLLPGTSYRVEEGGPSAVPGEVVWANKGADLVWAVGFAAP